MRTYDPLIYPVDIAISKSLDELNKKYTDPDGLALVEQESDATTYEMKERGSGLCTVGIVFRKKPPIDIIAHEAFHAAHEILSSINQDFVYNGTNESWAYLIGWIALCIQDFSNKEFKENESKN